MRQHIIFDQSLWQVFSIFHEKGEMLPFFEHVQDGLVEGEPFSQEFIQCRVKSLAIEEANYEREILQPLYQIDIKKELHFWVKYTSVSVLNCIVLLAYLSKQKEKKCIVIHWVHPTTMQKMSITTIFSLTPFLRAYQEIVCQKHVIRTGIWAFDHLMSVYQDAMDDNGILTQYLNRYAYMGDENLVHLLMSKFWQLGYTDEKFLSLIAEKKRKK